MRAFWLAASSALTLAAFGGAASAQTVYASSNGAVRPTYVAHQGRTWSRGDGAHANQWNRQGWRGHDWDRDHGYDGRFRRFDRNGIEIGVGIGAGVPYYGGYYGGGGGYAYTPYYNGYYAQGDVQPAPQYYGQQDYAQDGPPPPQYSYQDGDQGGYVQQGCGQPEPQQAPPPCGEADGAEGYGQQDGGAYEASGGGRYTYQSWVEQDGRTVQVWRNDGYTAPPAPNPAPPACPCADGRAPAW